MIKAGKIEKEEFCQCMSCLCRNEGTAIYKFQIGKDERQTPTIKLCQECLSDFVGKSYFVVNGLKI